MNHRGATQNIVQKTPLNMMEILEQKSSTNSHIDSVIDIIRQQNAALESVASDEEEQEELERKETNNKQQEEAEEEQSDSKSKSSQVDRGHDQQADIDA